MAPNSLQLGVDIKQESYEYQFLKFLQDSFPGSHVAYQGRRQQLREIGGAKLKPGEQRFSPIFSGRNHKFSDQKQVISKKKGLRRNPKAFSGRNH